MKLTLALALLLTAAATAAGAEVKPGLKDTIAKPLADKLKIKPADQLTASGCILSETFNTQSATDYSMQFRLMTASGPEMFNFTGDYLVHADPSSFTLATSADTLGWARIMEAIERAAQSERPLDVQYDGATHRVFGITIRWNERCPTP